MNTTLLSKSTRRNVKLNKFAFGAPWLPDLLCKHWFTSSVWNFCRWVADVPPRETSLSGDERGETSAVHRLHPWRLKGSSAGWKSLKNEPLNSGSTAFSFRGVDPIQLIFILCTHDMGKNLTECLNFLFYSLEAHVFLWRPMLFVLLITLAMEPEDLPQQSILIILRTNKMICMILAVRPCSILPGEHFFHFLDFGALKKDFTWIK